MAKRASLLDDRYYDWKYIAIEGSRGTRIYRVPHLIKKLVRIAADYSDESDAIDLDTSFSELGMDKDDKEDFYSECVDTLLPEYASITIMEAYKWRTLHDAAASILKTALEYINLPRVDNGVRPRERKGE